MVNIIKGNRKIHGNNRKHTAGKTMIYGLLMVYGCIAAYIIVKTSALAYRWMPLDQFYMSLRVEWLDMFINEVNTTGLYTGIHRLYDQNSTLYLYLSHLGSLRNFDALHTFFYTQLIIACTCIAVYPVIFYRITSSIPLSLASILLFVFYKPYTLFLQNDSHFIYGWMTFITLPILYFLYREKWQNSNWLWVAVVASAGAVGNIFRGSSGLAVVVSLTVLMVIKFILPYLKTRDYRKILVGLLGIMLIIASQKVFTGTIPNAYQTITDQPDKMPLKGPWHTLYVGLGWEENPMGLYWLDECGYSGREHLLYDVNEGYFICKESPRYSEAIKDAYFETVFDNFGFVFGSYVRKCFKALNTVLRYSLANPEMWKSTLMYRTRITYLMSFITPFAAVFYLVKKYREDKSNMLISGFICLFICAVYFAFGMLPGIIANPVIREYLYGAISVIDMAVMATLFVCLRALYEFYTEKHGYKIR